MYIKDGGRDRVHTFVCVEVFSSWKFQLLFTETFNVQDVCSLKEKRLHDESVIIFSVMICRKVTVKTFSVLSGVCGSACGAVCRWRQQLCSFWTDVKMFADVSCCLKVDAAHR